MATPEMPRDVDVRAPGAVEEVEVGVERLAVAAEPDRQLALHRVEEQRVVALVARPPGAPRRPGSGGTNISGSTRVACTSAASTDLGRQHAVGDEEHVGVEAGALVAGPHLRHHAGDRTVPSPPGSVAVERHDVVELEVLARARPRPRTPAAWRPRCRGPAPRSWSPCRLHPSLRRRSSVDRCDTHARPASRVAPFGRCCHIAARRSTEGRGRTGPAASPEEFRWNRRSSWTGRWWPWTWTASCTCSSSCRRRRRRVGSGSRSTSSSCSTGRVRWTAHRWRRSRRPPVGCCGCSAHTTGSASSPSTTPCRWCCPSSPTISTQPRTASARSGREGRRT